jgi:hypothetical protein
MATVGQAVEESCCHLGVAEDRGRSAETIALRSREKLGSVSAYNVVDFYDIDSVAVEVP